MELMLQGVVLMVAGMAIVYAFLSVLIMVAKVTSPVVAKFNYLLPQDAPKKAPAKAASSSADADVALAIAVALGA